MADHPVALGLTRSKGWNPSSDLEGALQLTTISRFLSLDASFHPPVKGYTLCPQILPSQTPLLVLFLCTLQIRRKLSLGALSINLALPWQLCSSVFFQAVRHFPLSQCHGFLTVLLLIFPQECRLHQAGVFSVFLTTLPWFLIRCLAHRRYSSNIYSANERVL